MRLFALPLLALSSLLFATTTYAVTRPQYGGTLRLGTYTAPTSLDPNDSSQPDSIARRNLTALLFDTLVVTDTHGKVRPSLASSWQVDPGNQRWQFFLRPNVQFHDGSPLTPDAVAASLRFANPDWKVFPEASSVVIERELPSPNLPADLCRPRNSIARRSGANLSGTGPFQITSFVPAKHLALAANETYWAGRPYLDAIDIDLGRNPHDQLLALELGRADIAEVGPDQSHRASLAGRRVSVSAPIELFAVVFSHDAQSAEDHALRSALALSIDRVSIRNVVLQSSGEPTAALLPNWISGYAFVFPAAQNLAIARQKRSEVRQPPAWTLASDPTDAVAQVVAQRIVLNARDAGLNLQTTTSATPDLRLMRVAIDSPEPHEALTHLMSLLNLAAPKFPNASADVLYQAENAALLAQRVIPLFHLPADYALGSSVRNWSLSLTANPQWGDVWLGAPAP